MVSAVSDETWQFLSACLTRDLARSSETTPDWDAVVTLAERLGLSPLLHRVLKQANCNLPDEIRIRLTSAYWATLGRNLLRHIRLADIAQGLDASGIPFVLMKGLVLVGPH